MTNTNGCSFSVENNRQTKTECRSAAVTRGNCKCVTATATLITSYTSSIAHFNKTCQRQVAWERAASDVIRTRYQRIWGLGEALEDAEYSANDFFEGSLFSFTLSEDDSIRTTLIIKIVVIQSDSPYSSENSSKRSSWSQKP